METYRWRFYYSGIFMVWCVGYLEKTKLMSFLRTAKTRLTPSAVRMSRRSEPDSFIIVFDNVLNPLEKPLMHKRQIPRTKADLESIFREAGLIVHRCSGIKNMPNPYSDVCAWALY